MAYQGRRWGGEAARLRAWVERLGLVLGVLGCGAPYRLHRALGGIPERLGLRCGGLDKRPQQAALRGGVWVWGTFAGWP